MMRNRTAASRGSSSPKATRSSSGSRNTRRRPEVRGSLGDDAAGARHPGLKIRHHGSPCRCSRMQVSSRLKRGSLLQTRLTHSSTLADFIAEQVSRGPGPRLVTADDAAFERAGAEAAGPDASCAAAGDLLLRPLGTRPFVGQRHCRRAAPAVSRTPPATATKASSTSPGWRTPRRSRGRRASVRTTQTRPPSPRRLPEAAIDRA